MAVQVNLPFYSEFDCKSAGVLVRWNKWRARLENNVFVGYNITDDCQKKALLLSYAGNDLNDIVDSLPSADLLPGEGETHFNKLTNAITNHFNPQINTEFQRYTFRKLTQKSDQIDDFYHALRQHADTCNFGDRISEEIKSQLIAGCKSHKIREKGLSTPNMTLADLLNYGRTIEVTQKHSKEIENHANDDHVNMFKNKTSTKPFQSKSYQNNFAKCNNCGRNWPHQGGQINVHDSNDDEEEDYVFMTKQNFSKLPKVELELNGQKVTMLADSGATINTISEKVFQSLKPQPSLEKYSKKLIPYGKNDPVIVTGCFCATIKSKTASCESIFCVVPDDEVSLLSWKLCQTLNILKVHDSVMTIRTDITDKNNDIFTGLGKKDIKEQIQRDLERDVIEKANGPTPWVSPVVVVDLNQGYNRLELDEESRYITTFATHLGLFRYKRLSFGINSAAEVFQEAIRQAVHGLTGVINISDDILIYGHTDDDHNTNLEEKNNPADYLSRHPCQKTETSAQETLAEEYIKYVISSAIPKTMTVDHVMKAIDTDITLQAVIKSLQTGIWKPTISDINHKAYETFSKLKDELTLSTDNKILLKNSRIVLPTKLYQQAVHLAHTGHQGIVKTLSLLREKVWFPGMHVLVENIVRNCLTCQITTETNSREPLKMSTLPNGPWQELSADFTQIPIVIIIKEYVMVEIISSLSAKSVIPRLDKVFSEFGIPNVLKTDNGPPFNGYEFKDYAEHTGFKHRKITPLWPRANAEAECFMRTLKKSIKGSLISQRTNWKQEMYKFLLAYRTTPHSSTGVPPATALFQRNIKNRLPCIDYQPKLCDSKMRKKDADAKQKMKNYADNKVYVKPNQFKEGDAVLLKDVSLRKSKTPYEPIPYTVTATKGSMITAKCGDRNVTRNSSFFKCSPQQPTDSQIQDSISTPDCDTITDLKANGEITSDRLNKETSRYPARQRKAPSKFKDFIM
ncbi:hypothetical protein GQR58_004074 [Nymphon striatum]|nr:hypothetical protein GQR58_004074 [Nymphon striatum]